MDRRRQRIGAGTEEKETIMRRRYGLAYLAVAAFSTILVFAAFSAVGLIDRQEAHAACARCGPKVKPIDIPPPLQGVPR